MNVQDELKVELNLPFSSQRIAEIVYDVLRVDAEPKRSGVEKLLVLDDNQIKATFTAKEARQLRVCLTNFFEKVDLVVETVQVMGPPVSNTYEHFY